MEDQGACNGVQFRPFVLLSIPQLLLSSFLASVVGKVEGDKGWVRSEQVNQI
jgi:hypothetical protein